MALLRIARQLKIISLNGIRSFASTSSAFTSEPIKREQCGEDGIIDIGTGTNSGKGKGQMGFTDWRMLKDARRRKVVKRDAVERLRLVSLKRNTVLPRALQEHAEKEIEAMARDGSHVRLVSRCVITSRARGVVKSWRLSRIMWRHLADYNYLSGVQRAMW